MWTIKRSLWQLLFDVAHTARTGKHASLYRVRAYRQAAQTVLELDEPIEELVAHEGRKGLKQLPGIGASLSVKIETLVRTGEIATLKEDDKRLVAV